MEMAAVSNRASLLGNRHDYSGSGGSGGTGWRSAAVPEFSSSSSASSSSSSSSSARAGAPFPEHVSDAAAAEKAAEKAAEGAAEGAEGAAERAGKSGGKARPGSADYGSAAAKFGSRKSVLRALQSRTSEQPAGNLWQDASLDAKFQLSKRTGSWVSRTWHFTQTFSLIIVIGMCATLWAVAMDFLMDKLNEARERMTCVAGNDENDCLSYCQCIRTGGADANATVSNPGDDAGLWFGFFCWSALMLLGGFLSLKGRWC